MRSGSRRALLGVLSVGAVLLPAVGIAYLGAVSYDADRGLVAAKVETQISVARTVAVTVEGRVDAALRKSVAVLGSSERPSSPELAKLAAALGPLVRPFRIDGDGELAYPSTEPLPRRPGPAPAFVAAEVAPCADGNPERCIRERIAAKRRAELLVTARDVELSACADTPDPCRLAPRTAAEARRLYTSLVRYDDSGPAALLGLARLARSGGRLEEAEAHYRQLRRRFATRVNESGLTYRLIADVGIAETRASGPDLLSLYGALLEADYAESADARLAVAKRVRGLLAGDMLDPSGAARLAQLDRLRGEAVGEIARARGLLAEVDEIARTAGTQGGGRPSLTGSQSTLVYRLVDGGAIVGLEIDNKAITAMASVVGADVGDPGTATQVLKLGASPDPATARTLATASFGPLLPHLSLYLTMDRRLADPLDEVVRERSRRHLAVTGALVVLLVIGLLATIRGAARERELARLKSDFVSTVSHELKTPLTSVRMFAEMLQQGVAGDDPVKQARYHDIIVKESERLGLLIANLLDYSQIERGTRRYTSKPVAVLDLAEEAVESFQRLRQGEGQTIAMVGDSVDEGARITVDREVVVQCLINLLANAVKYGGAEPIEVTVSAGDSRAMFSVTDHGPGIAKPEHSRIFREFYRTPSAYSSGVEGTGLGLALVKRHVEAQGGTVTVDSVVGRGSTFSIALPLDVVSSPSPDSEQGRA